MSENNQNNNKKEPSLSEVLKVRRDKLAALCEAGEDPFVKTIRQHLCGHRFSYLR